MIGSQKPLTTRRRLGNDWRWHGRRERAGHSHLTGDLGAGKTRGAGFLRACGVSGAVKSPTYTLVEVYETPTVSVVHLDLYRLLDPQELERWDCGEFARPGYLWLIEWPDREPVGAVPDLSVTLSAAWAATRST